MAILIEGVSMPEDGKLIDLTIESDGKVSKTWDLRCKQIGRAREKDDVKETISEAYAKAVRNWLVHYQVNCAELQGKYTPYEVLGWIVSDWRKENGIW